MGEKNRHFNREFKIDAVQMVREKKMSVSQVAQADCQRFCSSGHFN